MDGDGPWESWARRLATVASNSSLVNTRMRPKGYAGLTGVGDGGGGMYAIPLLLCCKEVLGTHRDTLLAGPIWHCHRVNVKGSSACSWRPGHVSSWKHKA